MTHSACARLRRAHRVRRFDERGPARTLNRLGVVATWIAGKPTFDRLAQSLSNESRCASFQGAGFCLGDLAGRSGEIGMSKLCGRRWRTGVAGPSPERGMGGTPV